MFFGPSTLDQTSFGAVESEANGYRFGTFPHWLCIDRYSTGLLRAMYDPPRIKSLQMSTHRKRTLAGIFWIGAL